MEEKTLKDLKLEVIALGMPTEDAELFTTKAPILAVINTLKASQALDEVKKVASINEVPNPVEEKQVNKAWKSKAEIMRDKLYSMPTVRYLIPLDPNEKPGVVEWITDKNGVKIQKYISGAIHVVQLNGFKYFVPKGVFIDIPQQVGDELAESYRVTSDAGKDYLVDRVDPKTGKQVSESL